MTWVFNKNLTPTGPEDAIFQLKAVLKTATWTVQSSSDGTTFNAAGDQITVAGSGAGGMSNTKAWFRIRSPAGAGGHEFTFQRGTTNNDWRVKYSAGAGFTGGTAGATQTPSATDEGLVKGGGSDATPTFATIFSMTTGFRWHTAADNATPYAFWASGYATGGGGIGATGIPALIVHDPMTASTSESLDTDATVIVCPPLAATSGQALGSTTYLCSPVTGGFGGGCYAWFKKGLTGASFDNLTGMSSYIMGATTSTPFTGSFSVLGLIGLDNAASININLGTSDYTAKDNLLPIFYTHLNSDKIDAFKGVSSVMRWIGAPGRNQGDTYTVSTAKDRIIIDALTFPWDGSVPTI